MSTIRFFALGGLGEVGKNMYILEADNKIFVFDCGSTNPSSQVFGYDSIIPDFKYLLENQDRVAGVFITHFKYKAAGGITRVIKDLKVNYYASRYTIDAIEQRFLNNVPDEEKEGVNFLPVSTKEPLIFDDITIKFFNVASSMPGSYGIAVKLNVSNEGEEKVYKNVVYLPDFDFDQNVKPHFRTNFKIINKIADEGVLALFCPSTGAHKLGHNTTDGKLDIALHKLMAHKGRTYILMDAENVSGMLQVIDAVHFQKRKVTIIGAKARSLVELAINMNYSPMYEENYLPKTVLNDELRNSEDAVIIIAGEQTEEFYALQRIAQFSDKHYILKPSDNVIFLLDTQKKYEKVLADSWDNIWLNNANLVEFDVKLMPNTILAEEDIKLLYSLLSPEYVVPITGDYRMLKAQEDIALKYGYDKEHVISLENGSIAKFEDGVYINDFELLETGDILFLEESDSDINDYVAREREALTQEGFIVVSGMINLKTRNIYGNVQIAASGFLPEYGSEIVYDKIKDLFKEIVARHLKLKKVDYKELRLELKNDLSKMILRETKKRPTLIPVVVDISN